MIYKILKPLLFRLDPEQAHTLAAGLLAFSAKPVIIREIIRAVFAYEDPILATQCAGLAFPNPIGLAAGFDKQARLIEGMACLGFGHIEIGTVTPRPQPGNPKPRMFRLPEDDALINRLGFNSPGMLAVAAHLRNARCNGILVGANLGKNRETALERAAEDYLAAFIALAPLADYVAINISSPNTPGLRRLHQRAALEELIGALANANQKLQHPRPLFLKVSPDEGEIIEDVVAAGLASGVSGFIATNTTLRREGLHGSHASETGGLSGRPLATHAAAVTRQIRTLAGPEIPIIAVGGIFDAEEAYQRIRAGASLVQIYTALVYNGPGIAQQIKRGVAKRLRRDGFRSIGAAVG